MPARLPSACYALRVRTRPRVLVGLAAPSIIAVANVLSTYSNTTGHWSAAVRPVAVSAIAAVLITAAILATSRRSGFTVAASSALVGLVTGHPLGLLGSLAILSWGTLQLWSHSRGRAYAPIPTGAIAGSTAFALVVVMVWTAFSGAIDPADFDFGPETARGAPARVSPNLYILLLDGYPRRDTLQNQMGFDNSPFLDRLADLGFTIYPHAMSPTARTERTLLAMLSTPVQANGPEPPDWRPGDLPLDFRRDTRRSYRGAGGPELARQAGYQLVHIAPPSSHVYLTGWDVTIESGQLNELEVELLQQSPVLAPLVGDWVLSQLRDRVEASLRSFPEQARLPGQKIVLAHVVSPHAPLIYGSHVPECWARGCSIWGYPWENGDISEPYAVNLRELNRRVLESLESLIAADPTASVVVMSDHGLRENQPQGEWQRSLLAARQTDIFEDDPTVTNVLYRWLRSSAVALGGT